MDKFFNHDIPVYNFIFKLVTLILLGVIWIILSIPLFTAGAATATLYYTTVKCIRYEEGNTFKSFFSYFIKNLKSSIIPSLLFSVLPVIIIISFVSLNKLAIISGSSGVFSFISLSPLIPILLIFPYFFPVFSRFSLPIPIIIRNCLYFSIRYFFTTLLCWILIVGCFIVLFMYPHFFIFTIGPCFWLISIPMEKVLVRYTKPEDNSAEKNTWYLKG